MISTFLAGRISEEMFLKSKTTSCIYDLRSARQIATDMVTKFGMGETQGVTALNFDEYPQISDEMKENICRDIQKILVRAEKHAKEILEKHHAKVINLADLLLNNGTLNKSEISDFFSRQQK